MSIYWVLLRQKYWMKCLAHKSKTKTLKTMTTTFGTCKITGQPVHVVKLSNEDLRVSIMTLGATIVSLESKDRDGSWSDVVLGFDTLPPYQSKENPYFGAVCGRYANRIARGRFEIDGTEHKLATNNGENHLHG